MKKLKYVLLLNVVCTLLVVFMCSCGNSIEGTYYEWSFAKDEKSKIVFANDGKCLFYGVLADGSEMECGGEYSTTENGAIVSLDIGETFEFVKDGDYLLFDGTESSRWYKDKEKAVKEWESMVQKNNEYITEHIYYRGIQFSDTELFFLKINNLDSKGNAEYEIYESKAYDPAVNDCFSADFNGTELWNQDKHIIESGELELGYTGDKGYINSDSDFLANYEYTLSMEGSVLQIDLDDEEYDYRDGWYQLDYNDQVE